MDKIDVLPCFANLESGYVRLVESMGSDLAISRSARVSYNADWRAGVDTGSDAKLIRYLLKNNHTRPFESVSFTFEVKAPIFVYRQWHRHRTWSYNEMSARYTELDLGFYVPTVEIIGKQSLNNKQARDMISGLSDGETKAREEEIQWVQEHALQSHALYHKLLGRAWPRELARAVLPLSSYSKMFASVDLHNLFHFCKLRLHAHAQYEIRVYAEAVLKLIEPIVPVAAAAFREFQLETK
ncbi:MAG: FAD-dependent thymidylate synthase [Rhabdochlamydiaceae bacterium]